MVNLLERILLNADISIILCAASVYLKGYGVGDRHRAAAFRYRVRILQRYHAVRREDFNGGRAIRVNNYIFGIIRQAEGSAQGVYHIHIIQILIFLIHCINGVMGRLTRLVLNRICFLNYIYAFRYFYLFGIIIRHISIIRNVMPDHTVLVFPSEYRISFLIGMHWDRCSYRLHGVQDVCSGFSSFRNHIGIGEGYDVPRLQHIPDNSRSAVKGDGVHIHVCAGCPGKGAA